MKTSLFTILIYGASFIGAAPQLDRESTGLARREAAVDPILTLEKRKGGGGGGGRSGGSSSGGGRSSGSGSSGGSSSGGGRSTGSTGRGSSTSNSGGSTKTGSGTSRSYGGRYAGGAAVPYKAGSSSPTRKIAPYAIGGAAVGGFGAYYATPWIYPVYAYGYPIGYSWNANGRNHTTNVTCVCQTDQTCGCDPDNNSTFLAQVLTNGTGGAPVNNTIVRMVEFPNGTANTYINGSLANGTTAPGGTEDAFSSSSVKLVTPYGGYGIMIVTVIAGVMLI